MSEWSALTYRDIAAALGRAGGVATANTVAKRMSRGKDHVERGLDQLVEAGAAESWAFRKTRRYRITGTVPDGIVGRMACGRRPIVRAESIPIACDDPDDEIELDGEAARAAQIWAQRMGKRRWHDDPRALRQAPGATHLLPPFEPRE